MAQNGTEVQLETKELRELGSKSINTNNAALVDKAKYITVGVCFRTESGGKAHEYDRSVFNSLNKFAQLGFEIRVVTLPRGASGPNTPARLPSLNEIRRDLDEVDLLYIPGGVSALESQIATSQNEPEKTEEQNLNKTSTTLQKATRQKDTKDARRLREEYDFRSVYEHRLIEVARTRGMIIMGICGGSWRLLEAYGGSIRTLPITERATHLHPDKNKRWELRHPLTFIEGAMLDGLLKKLKLNEDSILPHSTHWAVPVGNVDNSKLVIDPAIKQNNSSTEPAFADQLEVSLRAKIGRPESDTIEGFETKYGAPVTGLLPHFESNLPGLEGYKDATIETRTFSQEIFIYFCQAAMVYKSKRLLIASNPELNKSIIAELTPGELYQFGCDYYHGNSSLNIVSDMRRAAFYLEFAANKNHPGAQSLLGNIVEHGRAGKADMAKAFDLYRKGANNGDVTAMFFLGYCYEHGRGVKTDLATAARLYYDAYIKGYEGWEGYFNKFLERHTHLKAQLPLTKQVNLNLTPKEHFELGCDYYHGRNGKDVDMQWAAAHFEEAARKNHPGAQTKLADIFENGRGVDVNIPKAIALYQRAVEGGNPLAMFSLGRCFEKGKGVAQDLKRAAELYGAANKQCYEGYKGYYISFVDKNPSLRDLCIPAEPTTNPLEQVLPTDGKHKAKL